MLAGVLKLSPNCVSDSRAAGDGDGVGYKNPTVSARRQAGKQGSPSLPSFLPSFGSIDALLPPLHSYNDDDDNDECASFLPLHAWLGTLTLPCKRL